MIVRTGSSKGLAAVLAAASLAGTVPASPASAASETVTYEVTSSGSKPFSVMYVVVAESDSLNRTHQESKTETVGSGWRRDVTLSLGSDYAMVMVMSDPTNIEPTAKFSCKISAGFQQVDAASEQGMVGCAGKKVKARTKGSR